MAAERSMFIALGPHDGALGFGPTFCPTFEVPESLVRFRKSDLGTLFSQTVQKPFCGAILIDKCHFGLHATSLESTCWNHVPWVDTTSRPDLKRFPIKGTLQKCTLICSPAKFLHAEISAILRFRALTTQV